jgi:hypothetical protein
MSKDAFIRQTTTTATALAQSFDTANVLIAAYFDRGYGSGGANELTTNDLVAVGLSPAQIASAITLFQQLQALRNGGAVMPADYDATLNNLRQDL